MSLHLGTVNGLSLDLHKDIVMWGKSLDRVLPRSRDGLREEWVKHSQLAGSSGVTNQETKKKRILLDNYESNVQIKDLPYKDWGLAFIVQARTY